jgi:hypothetical protein
MKHQIMLREASSVPFHFKGMGRSADDTFLIT